MTEITLENGNYKKKVNAGGREVIVGLGLTAQKAQEIDEMIKVDEAEISRKETAERNIRNSAAQAPGHTITLYREATAGVSLAMVTMTKEQGITNVICPPVITDLSAKIQKMKDDIIKNESATARYMSKAETARDNFDFVNAKIFHTEAKRKAATSENLKVRLADIEKNKPAMMAAEAQKLEAFLNQADEILKPYREQLDGLRKQVGKK